MTVTLPAPEPVAVTLQLPPESGQVEAPNMTVPEPLCDQLTVPVGLEPVTVAVQVLNPPTATGDGEQVTAVNVGILPTNVTFSEPVPELGPLFASPL